MKTQQIKFSESSSTALIALNDFLRTGSYENQNKVLVLRRSDGQVYKAERVYRPQEVTRTGIRSLLEISRVFFKNYHDTGENILKKWNQLPKKIRSDFIRKNHTKQTITRQFHFMGYYIETEEFVQLLNENMIELVE